MKFLAVVPARLNSRSLRRRNTFLVNNKPLIALTATATEKVKKDIIKNLGIEDSELFISSFNRPNLYYEIRQIEHVDTDLIKFIKHNSNNM